MVYDDLVVYDRPEDVRVYGLCEDDWPVVYVFSKRSERAYALHDDLIVALEVSNGPLNRRAE